MRQWIKPIFVNELAPHLLQPMLVNFPMDTLKQTPMNVYRNQKVSFKKRRLMNGEHFCLGFNVLISVCIIDRSGEGIHASKLHLADVANTMIFIIILKSNVIDTAKRNHQIAAGSKLNQCTKLSKVFIQGLIVMTANLILISKSGFSNKGARTYELTQI